MATQPILLSQPLISQPPTVMHSPLTNVEVDDDAAIADQVKATHHPSGATNLNANFILSCAENILNFNHLPQKLKRKRMQKELPYQVIQLSFEVAFKCLNNIDCHSATIHLLSMLSTYPWDTKRPFFATRFPFIGLENTRVLLTIVSDTNLSEATFLYHHLSEFYISPWIILIPIIDYPQVWTGARTPSLLLSEISHRLELLDPYKRITPQFIRFLKERCVPSFQSGGEPIVISLDSRGRLVHTNALHMILTWRGALAYDTLNVGSGNNIISLLQKELTEMTSGVGSVIDDIEEKKRDLVNHIRKTIDNWRDDINMRIKDSDSSYNYTSKNEEMLWDKETWNLKLLSNDKGQSGYLTSNYDIDSWIANWVVNSQITLDIKFAYIGNNKKAKSLVKNLGGRIEDEDKIFLGLQKLLAYEAKSTTFGAWVLLSKGEDVVSCDFGDKMMRVMNAYQKWKNNMHSKGFSQAFKDCYEKLASSHDQHSCCMLEYPLTLDKISEDVKCPQCSHNMHKFVTFTCYHDCHHGYDDYY
nr:protein SIEVE ELEMENT OCCLUSION B-like [Ipomoea trifida]